MTDSFTMGVNHALATAMVLTRAELAEIDSERTRLQVDIMDAPEDADHDTLVANVVRSARLFLREQELTRRLILIRHAQAIEPQGE